MKSTIDEQLIEQVNQFRYLGSLISCDDSISWNDQYTNECVLNPLILAGLAVGTQSMGEKIHSFMSFTRA